MSFNTITQAITPAAAQQCVGVDLYFTEAGADAIITLAQADETGLPKAEMAQARVALPDIKTDGSATRVLLPQPVHLQAATSYALGVSAADPQTALQVARVGEVSTSGALVTVADAAIGAMHQINQAGTITRHAQRMLRFALIAAHYDATQKTITLGELAVTDATSIMIMAGAAQPDASASTTYQAELLDAGGNVVQSIDLAAGQLVTLAAPHSGSVRAKATLRASDSRLGAVLQPGTLLVVGTLDTGQTYITPAIASTGGDELRVIFEGEIPAGSAVAVDAQQDGGAWQAVPYLSSSPQTTGVIEFTHQLTGITASALRLRLTLTGTTKARPKVRNLRAVVL